MILITGGFGFLGSNLAESLLADGEEVCLLTRSYTKYPNIIGIEDKARIVQADVTDLIQLQRIIMNLKPSTIFHLAGQLTSYESHDNPFYDVDVNAKSTMAILTAIRELGLQRIDCRLVLGSTVWVVGYCEDLPMNEETPCNPLNIYAADRLASEHYCRIYHNVYNVDAVVMRLGNTFGVHEQYDNKRKAALNHLLYLGYKGEKVPLYSKGKVMRDYTYVSDVVEAAKIIADKGNSGETYFVGTGVGTWFYDIGKWIEELTPGKVEYIEPPDFHKRIDIGDTLIDSEKLQRLGWKWKVSVREGLEKTLEYYKELGL